MPRCSRLKVILGVVVLWSCPCRLAPAQDPAPKSGVVDAASKLAAAKQTRERDASMESRLREATWRLLLGEAAAESTHSLSSGSFDSLSRGLAELEALLSELEQSPELERRLSQQPQLAMRLDVAVARRAAAVAKKELSRESELARLSQLRDLNRVYRELIRHLLLSETEGVEGRSEAAIRNGDEVSRLLAQAEQIVGQRRDFYLFDDEPALADGNPELKLIRELAQPYSAEVRRHHDALLGAALGRQALRFEPPNQELLEAALARADAALTDAAAPSAIALYARGLASLELGRLLTRSDPFRTESHAKAAEWFAKSQAAFLQALKFLPEQAAPSDLRAELERLIAEGTGPDRFLIRSQELESRGDWPGATRELTRGLTRHRSPILAIALIESRGRSQAASLAELDQMARQLLDSGIVDAQDVGFRSLRGRIGVLGVWRQLSEADPAQPLEPQLPQLLSRLLDAMADLKAAPPNAEHTLRMTNAAVITLAEATALLLDKTRDTATAKQAFNQVPLIVAELEQQLNALPAGEQARLLEAIQTARLAEGYLALRLAPDYQDRARLAFAASIDAGAKRGPAGAGLRPLGGAMLRALLQRDGAQASRLAQEERQLRASLQRMLPALAAAQLTGPEAIANSLVKSLHDAQASEPAWDPRQQLDSRDTQSARAGVLADSRAVVAMTLVTAGRPGDALRELLTLWWPESALSDLQKINWAQVRARASTSNDPLTLYALGLAVEEYALTEMRDADIKTALLQDALADFDRASQILATTAAWRQRWPYLADLAQAGHDRLASDEAAIRRAQALRGELRFADARDVLEETQRRHQESTAVRQELIGALVDEAQTSTDERQELLGRALEQAETAKRTNADLPTPALMQLAELRERAGRTAEAEEAYREVVEKSADRSERLRARSRLAILGVRQEE